MITKRIIPCLDVKDGRVVKGVNFQGLNDVSSPIELGKYYSDNGADGPLRAPYSVYFQGGLTWYHAKVGILKSLQRMYEQGLVELKEV